MSKQEQNKMKASYKIMYPPTQTFLDQRWQKMQQDSFDNNIFSKVTAKCKVMENWKKSWSSKSQKNANPMAVYMYM